jgi:hypothetical protein
MTQPTACGPRCFPRRARPGAIALLLSSLLLLLLGHPLIHGDGVAYLVLLDSVAGDGDLDLSDQVARFAPAITYPFKPSPITGTPVTPFPFGSAYLLAPFYWLGRALEPLLPALRAYPEHFARIQGLPLAYSLMITLGAHVYALAAVGLAYQTARRVAPDWAAGLAAVACLAGTPLLYYATVEPMDAHVYGAFAVALALWLAAGGRSDRPGPSSAKTAHIDSWHPVVWQRALVVGLALGLATLVRWQLLLYALPIGLTLVCQARPVRPRASYGLQSLAAGALHDLAPGRWRVLPSAVAFAAGLGLFCGVCALYFWRFFGALLVVPNDAISGGVFVGAPLRYLPQVLLARHNGWLSWSPIAALGLAGLAGIARWGQAPWRGLALACLAGIALELTLNASLGDWFGGWAFGQRRMTEAYPMLVVGAAWLVGRNRSKALAGATILCAIYGAFLLVAHLYYTHTSGHPEGGGIADVARWLLTGPHGPTLVELFRDRYGPWAWARPEL